MKTFILALSAAEVVHLLQAETKAENGQPEFNTTCEKDYTIEEDFDHGVYGIRDEERFDLVTSVTTLTVEPRREGGYWVLSVVVERMFGLVSTSDENDMAPAELTLDEFTLDLQSIGQKTITVRVDTETSAVKKDFDYWLADMRARHPWAGEAVTIESFSAAGTRQTGAGQLSSSSKVIYRVREAIGTFADPGAFGAAVDELNMSGFGRGAISVFVTDLKTRAHVGRLCEAIVETKGNDRTLWSAAVPLAARVENNKLVRGSPLCISGFYGAWAIAAAGSNLALAVAAAIVLDPGNVDLSTFLATAVERSFAARAQEQLRDGGVILWVNTPTPEAEERSIAVLTRMNACDVHIHETACEWSIKRMLLADTRNDTFPER
jgi:hypothetical protein